MFGRSRVCVEYFAVNREVEATLRKEAGFCGRDSGTLFLELIRDLGQAFTWQ